VTTLSDEIRQNPMILADLEIFDLDCHDLSPA
jgi:hypothetical protein